MPSYAWHRVAHPLLPRLRAIIARRLAHTPVPSCWSSPFSSLACLGARGRHDAASANAVRVPPSPPPSQLPSPLPISASVKRPLYQALLFASGATAVGASSTTIVADSAPEQQPDADTTTAGQPLTRDEANAVRAAINALLDEREELALALIGLAWSAGASFRNGRGGSDDAGARAACLSRGEGGDGTTGPLHAAQGALSKIGALFPALSEGDLWTLGGAVALEYVGGPAVTWRAGRRHAKVEEADESGYVVGAQDGREEGRDEHELGAVGNAVRAVRAEYAQQGFTDGEIVALKGAYAMLHKYRGGGGGEEEGRVEWGGIVMAFGNDYFRDLVGHVWTLKRGQVGDAFEDRNGHLVMGAEDMALLWDKDLRNEVEAFAQDEDKFYWVLAQAFQKLCENGVEAFSSKTAKPWYHLW